MKQSKNLVTSRHIAIVFTYAKPIRARVTVRRTLALLAALLGCGWMAAPSWAAERTCTPAIAWSDVPAKIRDRLVQTAGGNISPQGGPFNSTDVVIDDMPGMRFFGTCRMNDQWTIALEIGGRGYHLRVFEFSGDALIDAWPTDVPKGGFTPDVLTKPADATDYCGSYYVCDSDPMLRKVAALVEQTTKAGTENLAFAELEALSAEGVPYIVAHLGDARPLPVQQISLVNHPANAFEGLRHYGPKTVHDALAAILNQITGQSFEFVSNGSTPEQRATNKQQWQAWCQETFPHKSAICLSSAQPK
jgi:hypothetical protein